MVWDQTLGNLIFKGWTEEKGPTKKSENNGPEVGGKPKLE